MRRVGLLILGLSVVGLVGCGGGTDRQAVSGTVTWKGQPLDTGMIQFIPAGPGGASQSGAVITKGRFEIPRDQGLVPGRYKVTISSPDPKSGQGPPDAAPGDRGGYPAKERIAEKYNTKTELSAEVVSGGKNEFEFKLD